MQIQSMKWVFVLAMLSVAPAVWAQTGDMGNTSSVEVSAPPVSDPVTNITTQSGIATRRYSTAGSYNPLADYSGYDFSRQNLPFSRFRNNLLSNARFTEAILMESDFRRAILTGADMSGASLMGADMRRAEMSRVRLEGANLRDARLKHANLAGATFDKATQFPLGFVPEHHGMIEVPIQPK